MTPVIRSPSVRTFDRCRSLCVKSAGGSRSPQTGWSQPRIRSHNGPAVGQERGASSHTSSQSSNSTFAT
jgi:hypothetical protein